MSRDRVRWSLLCEDREMRSFFSRLGELVFGEGPRRIHVAPRGEGAAEEWVRKQYPSLAKTYRQFRRENVALLVAIDGDREGTTRRKRELDEALVKANMSSRTSDEAIAVCVPTWSIETWIVWLCGWEGVTETQPYKDSNEYTRARRTDEVSAKAAVAKWTPVRPGEQDGVPSLTDARTELQRMH
jgi:hypothetical protein